MPVNHESTPKLAQLTSIELWPGGRHGWIRHAIAAGRLELLLDSMEEFHLNTPETDMAQKKRPCSACKMCHVQY
jgi:hypothetical protein